MAVYALSVKSDDLLKLAGALGTLSDEGMGQVIVDTVNDVASDAYDLARKRMTQGINLTDDYLRRKMEYAPATARKPQASITAVGQQVTLSHYRPVQKQRDVTWSNARIQGMGKKFGKWPGWTQRTGNRPIGIAPDRKANGISATVKDSRDGFNHAFSIVKGGSAIRDGEGNPIMFTRARGADRNSTRALLGPAVYQLFKYQLNGTLMGDTEEMLAERLADQVQAAMEKEILK